MPARRPQGAGSAGPTTGRSSPRSCTRCRQAAPGESCRPSLFGVSRATAHRRFTQWTAAGLWERLHHRLLNQLGVIGEIDWSRAVVDSIAVRAEKGAADRPESRRPRQTRLEDPRPPRHRSPHRPQGRRVVSAPRPAPLDRGSLPVPAAAQPPPGTPLRPPTRTLPSLRQPRRRPTGLPPTRRSNQLRPALRAITLRRSRGVSPGVTVR